MNSRMCFMLKCITVILLVGRIAGNNSKCMSTNWDESYCSELISTTSSGLLDNVMNLAIPILKTISPNGELALEYVRQIFQPNPANLTNYESFAKSFYLIIFNPGGKEGRNVSLTDVLKDCSVLQLNGKSSKVFWSGYSNDCNGSAPSQITLGFSNSQMQQYADASYATVIAVDWGTTGLSCYGYFQLLFCLFDQMADLFKYWLTKCVNIETLDLIGHSMGAQIVGYIAQHLKSAGKPARALIGLDPALPGFESSLRCEGVQSGVAKYVAAYHCNPGAYATDNFHIGNASILINQQCNFCQVGCECSDSSCNHAYCLKIFLELTQNNTITATRTDNPLHCPGSDKTQLTAYKYPQNGYYCVNTYENGKCPT